MRQKLYLAQAFRSEWDGENDRIWIGPEYWANPMKDWRLKNGQLECLRMGAHRNVHLLMHQLGKQQGSFETSVIVGLQQRSKNKKGTAGFHIGIKSELRDYRSSLLRGQGIRARTRPTPI